MSSDSRSTGGYVHRPDEAGSLDADGDAVGPESGVDATSDRPAEHGWGLVAVVVLAVLVVPGFIYLYPTVLADLGVPFLVAFLVLPFLPALLLGLTAVWSMRGEKG